MGLDDNFAQYDAVKVAILNKVGDELGSGVGPLHDRGREEGRIWSIWLYELLKCEHILRSIAVDGADRDHHLRSLAANLGSVAEVLVPVAGSYTAWVTMDIARCRAAVSILIDRYGKLIELHFADWLKRTHGFFSMDGFIRGMSNDATRVGSRLPSHHMAVG